MNASPYLIQPRRPCPAWLPGDVKIDARGIYVCRATVWLGFGRGAQGWCYMMEAL